MIRKILKTAWEKTNLPLCWCPESQERSSSCCFIYPCFQYNIPDEQSLRKPVDEVLKKQPKLFLSSLHADERETRKINDRGWERKKKKFILTVVECKKSEKVRRRFRCLIIIFFILEWFFPMNLKTHFSRWRWLLTLFPYCRHLNFKKTLGGETHVIIIMGNSKNLKKTMLPVL